MLVVGLLFAKTVYTELEVDTEMQHGLLPGALALAAKFVPTMKQAGPHPLNLSWFLSATKGTSNWFWGQLAPAVLLTGFEFSVCSFPDCCDAARTFLYETLGLEC